MVTSDYFYENSKEKDCLPTIYRRNHVPLYPSYQTGYWCQWKVKDYFIRTQKAFLLSYTNLEFTQGTQHAFEAACFGPRLVSILLLNLWFYSSVFSRKHIAVFRKFMWQLSQLTVFHDHQVGYSRQALFLFFLSFPLTFKCKLFSYVI